MEKIETVSAFLNLLNPEIINFIQADDIQRTIIYRSTAGGGKSTIFRLFSPDILNELHIRNENYKECYEFLKSISVITSEKVNVLGVYIPCARNYSIIDDIYENGKRTQIFFALLNLRIIMATLKNIITLSNCKLHQIAFRSIPEELISQIGSQCSGQELYDWAAAEENKLCLSIDQLDGQTNIPYAHNFLFSLKLIEAKNILVDNSSLINRTLVMFDDVHKLTTTQRTSMLNCIFQLRPDVGIWIAERFSALDRQEVLGEDGKRGREYEERILEYFDKKKSVINKSYTNIADRRVRITKWDELNGFSACLDNEILGDNEIRKKIEQDLIELSETVFEGGKNKEIKEYYLSLHFKTIYDEAIFLRAIKILFDRELNKTQLALFDNADLISVELIKRDFDKVKGPAEFYFCIEQNIPYYYGIDKICNLSSYNVEQFLTFAGGIFERWIASNYVKKEKRRSAISPTEQEQIIMKIATDKWKEIKRQHLNADNIQKVLKTIANIGIESRKRALASYNGGAYTGIGIKEDVMNEILDNDSFKEITQILYSCVASNYLNVRTVTQGKPNEKWKVFYLNRWICSLNKLPLDYGGWKPINKNKINDLLNDPGSITKDDASEYWETEGNLFYEKKMG